MGDTEFKVPTPGGQLLDFCLKTIGEQEQLDANTMLALLSLVNLTNILELIGQGRAGGQLASKQQSEDSPLTALREAIPPGSDKMGMLNNLMGMLGGGGGDLSKLMPLVSMLGTAMKNNQQPAETPVPPAETEQHQEELAATEAEVKEPPAASGWARVGR
jgi:hypothetical protein